MRFANLFGFWFDKRQTIRNLHPSLILLVQLWTTKTDIVLFYQVCCWEKVDNLQKFRRRSSKMFVDILIFLVFSKSSIHYLREWKISVCKVLVQIKVVLVKNNYFLHKKIELHIYLQINGFLYWRSFYWKKFGAYISHKLNFGLIPIWIWYNIVTVSHFKLSNHQLYYFF